MLMVTPLMAMGFHSVLLFGKNAMDEHGLFHNRHIRIVQNTPVELAA
jgi:hypothetical protein